MNDLLIQNKSQRNTKRVPTDASGGALSMSWFIPYFPSSPIKGIKERRKRRERRHKSKNKVCTV